ncbi:glycosyltransferase, partial [candidate division KSB1 bacterium]
ITNNYQYEIIFVDDGSTDRTFNIIQKLDPLKIIRFRKNFGQTIDIDTGIKGAKYPYNVTLNENWHNSPVNIPALFNNKRIYFG